MGKGSTERFVPIGATAKNTLLRYATVFRPRPARQDIDSVFLSLDGYSLFLGYSSPFMTHHHEQFKEEHVLAQHRRLNSVDTLGISYRRQGKRKAVLQKINRG